MRQSPPLHVPSVVFVLTVSIAVAILLRVNTGPLRGEAAPTILFRAEDTQEEIELQANANNIFTCEGEGTFPLFGNALEDDADIRFWVYEYKGEKEPPFNGKFLLSKGELASRPSTGLRQALEHFTYGKKYYVMTEEPLLFTCGEGLKSPIACGDGRVEGEEECDDGERNGQDTCTQECLLTVCGDGNREGSEQCDDGNEDGDDGCDASCTTEAGWSCTGDQSDCTILIPSLDMMMGDGEEEEGDGESFSPPRMNALSNDQSSRRSSATTISSRPSTSTSRSSVRTSASSHIDFYDYWCNGALQSQPCSKSSSSRPSSVSARSSSRSSIDNDEDGRIDFPRDEGCTSASDTNETDDFKSPIGYLDGSVSCMYVYGWTCDQDTPDRSLDVHIYYDAPQGHTFVGTARATEARETAVGNLCGKGNNRHGFFFQIPSFLKDGQAHRLYAYGIDSAGGENSHLSSSPVTIVCH